MKFSELIKENKVLSNEFSSSTNTVSILSNVTVSQLSYIIEYYFRKDCVPISVINGDYDNIIQDSYKFRNHKLLIIFWEISNIIDGFQYLVENLSKSEFNNIKQKLINELDLFFQNIKKVPLVLFNEFSHIPFLAVGSNENRLLHICDFLNKYLLENAPSNVKIIRINEIFCRTGIEYSFDFRSFYSTKTLYSLKFLYSYVSFIKPILNSAFGRSKKVIVFDCDNTLWHGIIGEDGFNGIEMNDSPKGRVFKETQELVLSLFNRGVLVGICSKNNEADVEQVFSSHPDMRINNSHLACKRVNWNDKASNLIEMSKELNVGLDSFVFVDDNEFEIQLIKEVLPEVTTILRPRNLSLFPFVLRSNFHLFYQLSVSNEDKSKTEMYIAESQRNSSKAKFSTLLDYLSSLDIKMSVFINDKDLIPRMSQMTQKTNQFNFTTQRCSEEEINQYIVSENYVVFAFSVADRFGDSGVSGLAVIELDFNFKSAFIKSFLLSCRVLGRNLEYAIINIILKYLNENSIEKVDGLYIKSKKNNQVKDLYEKFGFKLSKKDELSKVYSFNLNDYTPETIDYIEVIYER